MQSSGRPNMRNVDDYIAQAMQHILDGQTDEKLMPQFGISYNTWRKVRAGMPIRSSVATRLERKVRSICSVEANDSL